MLSAIALYGCPTCRNILGNQEYVLQLAMCTACLKGFKLSPVQIVIIKGHHMTQHTDAFPRRNCADFSGQGRALKGREIAQPFVLNN
jgi:hypothetical protein